MRYVCIRSLPFSFSHAVHTLCVFMYQLRFTSLLHFGSKYFYCQTLAMVSLNANFHYSHSLFFVSVFYLENAIECSVFVCKHVSLSIYMCIFACFLSFKFSCIFFLFSVFMTDTYKVIRSFLRRCSLPAPSLPPTFYLPLSISLSLIAYANHSLRSPYRN